MKRREFLRLCAAASAVAGVDGLAASDAKPVLYERAKKTGVSEKKLREWFQYPRPIDTAGGLIYHWSSHSNHLHVRFKPARCPAASHATRRGERDPSLSPKTRLSAAVCRIRPGASTVAMM